MHAWLDFVTRLQVYTSFAYSWSTSKEYKSSDAVMPNQLLAADNDAVAYQMEQYKNLGLVIIFHCLNSL